MRSSTAPEKLENAEFAIVLFVGGVRAYLSSWSPSNRYETEDVKRWQSLRLREEGKSFIQSMIYAFPSCQLLVCHTHQLVVVFTYNLPA